MQHPDALTFEEEEELAKQRREEEAAKEAKEGGEEEEEVEEEVDELYCIVCKWKSSTASCASKWGLEGVWRRSRGGLESRSVSYEVEVEELYCIVCE
eukprot:1194415-Prorocentrum_minimum.AAC.2